MCSPPKEQSIPSKGDNSKCIFFPSELCPFLTWAFQSLSCSPYLSVAPACGALVMNSSLVYAHYLGTETSV